MMSTTNITKDLSSKRIPRCVGCNAPLSEHSWSMHSQFCKGEEKSSPMKHITSKCVDVHEEIGAVKAELAEQA